MTKTVLGVLALLCIILLIISSGCRQDKKFNDNEVVYDYHIITPCTDEHPYGYWFINEVPRRICYSDEETLRHEECHEQAYRDGLTIPENLARCHKN